MTGRSTYTRRELDKEARAAIHGARSPRDPARGLARVRLLRWELEIGPQGARLVVHAVGSARDGRTVPFDVGVAL